MEAAIEEGGIHLAVRAAHKVAHDPLLRWSLMSKSIFDTMLLMCFTRRKEPTL